MHNKGRHILCSDGGDMMRKFKIPSIPPTTNKCIRIPNDVIAGVEKAIRAETARFRRSSSRRSEWHWRTLRRKTASIPIRETTEKRGRRNRRRPLDMYDPYLPVPWGFPLTTGSLPFRPPFWRRNGPLSGWHSGRVISTQSRQAPWASREMAVNRQRPLSQ